MRERLVATAGAQFILDIGELELRGRQHVHEATNRGAAAGFGAGHRVVGGGALRAPILCAPLRRERPKDDQLDVVGGPGVLRLRNGDERQQQDPCQIRDTHAADSTSLAGTGRELLRPGVS